MKFKFTKIACAAIAAAMLFSMTACGSMGGEIIDKVDKTKIQLNVFSYNGGVFRVARQSYCAIRSGL